MATTHRIIDARLLRLTQAVVACIERDASLRQRMVDNVSRWSDETLRDQWNKLLLLSWDELRALLLARTESGAALRQNAPLGGILPPSERARIMRECVDDSRAA